MCKLIIGCVVAFIMIGCSTEQTCKSCNDVDGCTVITLSTEDYDEINSRIRYNAPNTRWHEYCAKATYTEKISYQDVLCVDHSDDETVVIY